jgi:hypothetical protein
MISVHEAEKLSLEQIEKFLLATEEVRFEASQRAEVYAWVERLLRQQEYPRQGRRAFHCRYICWVAAENHLSFRVAPAVAGIPRGQARKCSV